MPTQKNSLLTMFVLFHMMCMFHVNMLLSVTSVVFAKHQATVGMPK